MTHPLTSNYAEDELRVLAVFRRPGRPRCDVDTVARLTELSPFAVANHTRRLVRRGVLRRTDWGIPGAAYELAADPWEATP